MSWTGTGRLRRVGRRPPLIPESDDRNAHCFEDRPAPSRGRLLAADSSRPPGAELLSVSRGLRSIGSSHHVPRNTTPASPAARSAETDLREQDRGRAATGSLDVGPSDHGALETPTETSGSIETYHWTSPKPSGQPPALRASPMTPDGPRAPRAPKRPHAMPRASPKYLKMIIRPQYIPRGGRSRPATSARRFFP